MTTQASLFTGAYDLLVEIATDLAGTVDMSDGCAKCAANIILSRSGIQAQSIAADAVVSIDFGKAFMGNEVLGAWGETCEYEPREVYEYAASNLCCVHAAPVSKAQMSFNFEVQDD